MKLPASIEWRGAKLHLGCGAKYLDGWINSDGLAEPVVQGVVGNPDIVLDIERDLRWIPDNALTWIYYCQGVEHHKRNILPGVLEQFHRILAPGGRLTLATTDLMKIINSCFPDGNWEGGIYGHAYSTDPPGLQHYDCFTWDKLTAKLGSAGFKRFREWKPTDYPEIHALNDFATTHAFGQLYVEAVKE